MAKRVNKADALVFKALQRAITEDKLNICLISSKINVVGSPVYNPWENLFPILLPVLFGLLLIGLVGILIGLAVMSAGIMLSSNLVKKKLEQRLFDRTKTLFLSDYKSCCELWDFGGLILVKSDDKKYGCIAPEGNWKEFVVLHFADLMTDGKKAEESVDEKVA